MARFSRAGRGRKRIQARSRGRFKRTTIEDFGMKVDICPKCGQLHPRAKGEPREEFCKSCGHFGLK